MWSKMAQVEEVGSTLYTHARMCTAQGHLITNYLTMSPKILKKWLNFTIEWPEMIA